MHPLARLYFIFCLSVATISAQSYDPYKLFEDTLDIQVLTGQSLINATSVTIESLKADQSQNASESVNSTLTKAYNEAVEKYNSSTTDQDCLIEAKYSADNIIADSIDELISCQQLTQAYEQVTAINGTSNLSKKLSAARNDILAAAKKCTQKDFFAQWNCMQRKAANNDPTIDSIIKEISANLHNVGGLSMLCSIEYGGCQKKEMEKVQSKVADIDSSVKACNPTTQTTTAAP